jgi:hypothetical protein
MTNEFDDFFNNTQIRAVCAKTSLNFRELIQLYHKSIRGAHKNFCKAKSHPRYAPTANVLQGTILESYIKRLEECIRLAEEVSNNLAMALLSPEAIVREIASEIAQDTDFLTKTKIDYENLLIEIRGNNESNSQS